MAYCFMNLRPAKDGYGRRPDFPEGVSFLLLADHRYADWGLYDFQRDQATEDWNPPSPVSTELAALLESGKRYPPALAIARNDVARLFLSRTVVPRDEFVSAFVESLSCRLSSQPSDGFVLAPAVQDEPGYLSTGEWHWILQVSETDPPSALWVSGDYFFYRNALTDFDIPAHHLRALKNSKVATRTRCPAGES